MPTWMTGFWRSLQDTSGGNPLSGVICRKRLRSKKSSVVRKNLNELVFVIHDVLDRAQTSPYQCRQSTEPRAVAHRRCLSSRRQTRTVRRLSQLAEASCPRLVQQHDVAMQPLQLSKALPARTEGQDHERLYQIVTATLARIIMSRTGL